MRESDEDVGGVHILGGDFVELYVKNSSTINSKIKVKGLTY